MNRNTKEIRVWMIRNSLKEKDIVRETGHTQPYVNKTINGTKNGRKILSFLKEKGCPPKYLAMPE